MYHSLIKLFIYKALLNFSNNIFLKLIPKSHLSYLTFSKPINEAKICLFINPFLYNNCRKKIKKYLNKINMCPLNIDSHKDLLDSLKVRGVIEDDDVYNTMIQVDRGKYIKENPYADTPVYICQGVTISSPHMHALSLKQLMGVLKPGARAIDVGSGSGYLTVCMAMRTEVLKNKNSFVIGIERVKDVVDFSLENIKNDKPELLKLDNFKIIHKNIYKLSEEEKEMLGLFDAIHVGASASELPQVLVDLLAENGKLIIPLDEGYTQVLYEITKKNGKIIKDRLFEVCFVTLKKN
ncbi:protein-L-isoaspartate(D-aspartate) O-methyltransferase, putative [Hepatocystis sp. ex Piliocolobus tephrosceles]|uniref:protein-L-isoaspartate(D-aspartate) O-methyltransferase n=1 Tax=Piliocolobus tephrosceles TaxID=591936 RepID=A0A8C9GKY4_9PRIM|nr:protein-L-isoaspartate(D-aspartate) O-methyltransferase, putative [Hepatocystis sp. ex Piliocolobus tephrosceles]